MITIKENSEKYWFTADEHYGSEIHARNRSYRNFSEMDYDIIKRHNKLVRSNNTVIHVGDFIETNDLDVVQNYIDKLNGSHVFIRGNNDKWLPNSNDNLTWIKRIEGVLFIAHHRPMLNWTKKEEGSILVHGHVHGLYGKVYDNAYDVGVDPNNFYPINVLDILKNI